MAKKQMAGDVETRDPSGPAILPPCPVIDPAQRHLQRVLCRPPILYIGRLPRSNYVVHADDGNYLILIPGLPPLNRAESGARKLR